VRAKEDPSGDKALEKNCHGTLLDSLSPIRDHPMKTEPIPKSKDESPINRSREIEHKGMEGGKGFLGFFWKGGWKGGWGVPEGVWNLGF
jgi:hypothetical protein